MTQIQLDGHEINWHMVICRLHAQSQYWNHGDIIVNMSG